MNYHIEVDIELKRNPHKGLYIALEGVDGCGKSTQSKLLQDYLTSKNIPFITTSEPRREGPIGELIHKILTKEVTVPSVSLQYLYTADRLINHLEVVAPALQRGDIVISHRCLWSNLPYGMLDKKMWDFESNEARIIDMAHGLLSLYHQFVVPDLTFYLRVSSETAITRLTREREMIELYEKKEKIERVIAGYEWEVKHFPDEFTIIDAEKPIAEISRSIINEVAKRHGQK